jgi:hypothetical protein
MSNRFPLFQRLAIPRWRHLRWRGLQSARRINKGRKSWRFEPGSGGGTPVHCAPVQGSEN